MADDTQSNGVEIPRPVGRPFPASGVRGGRAKSSQSSIERAQNSAHTVPRPIGRRFPPGVSGNPGGRPRGVARLAREATNDGADIVAFFVSILQGRTPPIGGGKSSGHRPSLKDRIEAARWLADRGFGKAPITVNDNDESERPLARYTLNELLMVEGAITSAEQTKII
jgi:hypothetical protein